MIAISFTLLFYIIIVSYFVCLFYRPPSSPVSVLDNFCTVLEGLNPSYFSNFVLVGDFNVDFYNSCNPQYCTLTDIMHSFSLMQAVREATPTGKETMLDLALISQMSKLNCCEVIPPLANSDHNGLILQWTWKSSGNQVKLSHDKYEGMCTVTLRERTICCLVLTGVV